MASLAELWRAGSPSTLSREGHHDSGFQVVVIDAEDTDEQIRGVRDFAVLHKEEIRRLRALPDVTECSFRVAYFWSDHDAALAYDLPADLHRALADCGASLTFCVYPCCD